MIMKQFRLFILFLLLGGMAAAQEGTSQRKAMEDAFIARMKAMADADMLVRISPDTSLMSKVQEENYYVLPGDTYILDEISSATYYIYNGQTFHALCDKRFPAETMANRLLLPDKELPDGELRLKFQKYRYETDSVNIQFKQFVSFCKSEGCEVYVGVENVEGSELEVDVFLYNGSARWLHIVNLECPVEKVADEGLSVSGNAWLFIPLANLRELMGKELPEDFMDRITSKTKNTTL